MDTAALEAIINQLRDHGCTGDGDTERVTQIRLLETLKSVASAVQAQVTADFARSREAELARIATESVRDRARRDVGAQIGLARRVSPRVGSRLVGMAKVLTGEMPALMGAFRRGAVDEYQAMVVVAETATLTREHRQTVDTELADRFGTLSTARARAAAASIGYRLDPDQAVKRLRKGLTDRRVTLRPAPDTMTYLTALLPATDGVAVLAALTTHAATVTAHGDPRGTGALMADELVSRLLQPNAARTTGPDPTNTATDRATGAHHTHPDHPHAGTSDSPTPASAPQRAHTTATGTGTSAATGTGTGTAAGNGVTTTHTGTSETSSAADGTEPVTYVTDGLPGVPAGVNIEIQLVMTDRTLLDGDTEPATLTGYGPIPAPLARHLTRGANPATKVWIRRLYTDPHTAQLTGGDQKRRLFSHTQRQFLITRDQVCRTPWCDAPIRHADHTQPHTTGGPTTPTNGAGLCAACNHTKEHPGWTHHTYNDGRITITTPTGHHYPSHPPNPPRSDPWEADAA